MSRTHTGVVIRAQAQGTDGPQKNPVPDQELLELLALALLDERQRAEQNPDQLRPDWAERAEKCLIKWRTAQ